MAAVMIFATYQVISTAWTYHSAKQERQATMKCYNQFRTEVPCP